jgi:hypothetical protein
LFSAESDFEVLRHLLEKRKLKTPVEVAIMVMVRMAAFGHVKVAPFIARGEL